MPTAASSQICLLLHKGRTEQSRAFSTAPPASTLPYTLHCSLTSGCFGPDSSQVPAHTINPAKLQSSLASRPGYSKADSQRCRSKERQRPSSRLPADVAPVLTGVDRVGAQLLLNSQQLVVLCQALRPATCMRRWHIRTREKPAKRSEKCLIRQGEASCLLSNTAQSVHQINKGDDRRMSTHASQLLWSFLWNIQRRHPG